MTSQQPTPSLPAGHVITSTFITGTLARLRFFNQTSTEAINLFSALASITLPVVHTHVLEHVLPFELDVIHAHVRWFIIHMSSLRVPDHHHPDNARNG
jgi:hypothetical protein